MPLQPKPMVSEQPLLHILPMPLPDPVPIVPDWSVSFQGDTFLNKCFKKIEDRI